MTGEQQDSQWWGDVRDKAEERKTDLLPSMICFLLRPLSVSALQTGGKEVHVKGANGHANAHIDAHTHDSRRSRVRSLNTANNSLHNKLPTNHRRELHPLDAPQCARSSRTNCAACLCSGQTQGLLSLSVLFTSDLPMNAQLALLWWFSVENTLSRQKYIQYIACRYKTGLD